MVKLLPWLLLSTGALIVAGQPADPEASARKELQPRPVNIADAKVNVEQALKILHEKTGNVLIDRRQNQGNVALQLKDGNFWPTLDDLVRQAGCGYSNYQEDGRLALVDTPLPRLQVFYQGIFRLAVKRVATVRDDETGAHFCTVFVELAWEPRFQPFLLDVGPVEAVFAGLGEKSLKSAASARGQVNVAGRNAVELDLRFPAPPRSFAAIASLTGRFNILGPGKLLNFTFANPKPGQPVQQTQEEVQVSVTPMKPQPDRWSYDVKIVNPPGGPRLESYQAGIWLFNNRIWLEKTVGNKTEVVRPLPSDEEEQRVDATGAHIHYHFTRDLPASQTGWSVVYRTPGRMVTLEVPFTMKEIPLP